MLNQSGFDIVRILDSADDDSVFLFGSQDYMQSDEVARRFEELNERLLFRSTASMGILRHGGGRAVAKLLAVARPPLYPDSRGYYPGGDCFGETCLADSDRPVESTLPILSSPGHLTKAENLHWSRYFMAGIEPECPKDQADCKNSDQIEQ